MVVPLLYLVLVSLHIRVVDRQVVVHIVLLSPVAGQDQYVLVVGQ
jgi:hypothetical protein